MLIDLVVKRDPNNFMALAIRAWGAIVEVVCGSREVSPADSTIALQFARNATELNGRSDFAHAVYAGILLYLKRDLDAVVRLAKRSLELNPNYALAMDMLGMATMYAGDAEAALGSLGEAGLQVHCLGRRLIAETALFGQDEDLLAVGRAV